MRTVKEEKWKLEACLRERNRAKKKKIIDVEKGAKYATTERKNVIYRIIIAKRNVREILLTINNFIKFFLIISIS